MWRYLGTVVLLVALAGCGGSSTPGHRSHPSSTSPSPSVAALPPLGPVGMVQAADGTVWAAYVKSDAIAALDEHGRPAPPVQVGDGPLRIAELDGSLWVTSIRDGNLTEVDPASGAVRRTIHLDGEPEGVAPYQGHLWVVLQKDAALVEVDPSDGKVLHRYRVGGEPRLVAPGEGALYVSDFAGGRVVRVDAGTGKVTRSAAVCAGVQDMQVHAGAVWSASMKDERLVGLDPQTLRVVGRVMLDGDPDGLTEGDDGALLVSLQDGPGLDTVDTSSRTVRRLFTGKSGRIYDEANNDVLVVGSTAYLSDFTGNTVTRVPLTP
jgi:DNA-binding beta-propeller fold protein YncE